MAQTNPNTPINLKGAAPPTDDYGIGAAPTGTTDDTEAKFIGPGDSTLTSSFRAKTPTPYSYDIPDSQSSEYGFSGHTSGATLIDTPPRYAVGDQWKPMTESWAPERVADLQSQLVDAGLLDKTKYQRGYWDSSSANAYEKLLGYSNASGLDDSTTLRNIQQIKSKYGSTDESGPTRQPFISQRRDPEALKSLLGAVSTRIMGAPLSPEEEDRFVTTFNDMSDTAQRAAYTASGSGLPGGPGGIDQEIDPEAQAQKYLRETHPKDIVRHDVVDRFNQFQSLLSKYS